jgi:hypothetical protein
MIRWLEANGFNVSYASGVDTDRMGSSALLTHNVFMSVGHDEYWSGKQRSNVEAARGAGVNLAFMSGNELFWKTRWESSIDGSATPYRTLVCYKETNANAKIDPLDPPTWTGTWMDPRWSPPADGGRPQNALTGTLFSVNGGSPGSSTWAIKVPQTYASQPFWRNTRVAKLGAGQSTTLAAGTLGYEWDENINNGYRPAGLTQLSSATFSNALKLQDYGSTYASATATHAMTIYRHSSGALVFSAGTVFYSWGLDGHHDYSNIASTTDVAMQQATVNLLSDMGVQPGSLQSGLVPGSQDVVAPTVAFTTPAANATVSGTVTLTASASDNTGVVGVEFLLDGVSMGAEDTASPYSLSWNTAVVSNGNHTLTATARDAAGNNTSASIAVKVSNAVACPCSVWKSGAAVGGIVADPNAVELGVKIQSDMAGYITGLRFYKSASNTGTHVGHLWTSTGTLLGSVTFAGETASGWQQASFASAIAINANTMYVASYHTDTGNYNATEPGLSTAADAPPLHALASGASGGNGLYAYGASGTFPTQSWDATNYWVDVVFDTVPTHETVPPTVNITAPSAGANVSGTISIAATATDNAGVAGVQFTVDGVAAGAEDTSSPYDVSWNSATVANGTHTIAAAARDTAGNTASASIVVTVQNTTGPGCPCSLWPASTAPSMMATDPSPLELGVKLQSETAGYITGIRFYKYASNTGTHVGHLWTSAGALLGTATFTNETASGWQQATFASPIPIAANTTYIASYHTDAGYYALTEPGFTSAIDRAPLHALADGASGGNGVYAYGSSAYPSQTWDASNYWVDVVFVTTP